MGSKSAAKCQEKTSLYFKTKTFNVLHFSSKYGNSKRRNKICHSEAAHCQQNKYFILNCSLVSNQYRAGCLVLLPWTFNRKYTFDDYAYKKRCNKPDNSILKQSVTWANWIHQLKEMMIVSDNLTAVQINNMSHQCVGSVQPQVIKNITYFVNKWRGNDI